jgi:hypothetical protein
MTIPFLFGLQIDLLAVFVYIFTMIVFVEFVKFLIRLSVCKIFKKASDSIKAFIDKDSFKLVVSILCGFVCFWALAKYGGQLPITDGTRIEISALTFLQFSIFVALTCGGYRLLKPVIVLWLETLKNKIFKKGE